jgi:DNA-binding NarL/FixJ family response regulator
VKFRCERDVLVDALNTAGRAVSTRGGSLPVLSGDEATRQIKQDLPETRVVALSMWDRPEVRDRMYEAGAESYVLKTAPTGELLAVIRGEKSDS